MPGSSLGPTTTAPAPSAKMKAVPRSPTSVRSDSRSTPITSTCLALPPRTMSEAMATPWQKPAQAALMSNDPGATMPSFEATWVEACGICAGNVQVATMTVSMSEGCSPASSMARRPASAPIMATDSWSPAKRRSAIPTRERIHSSLVSTRRSKSALVSRPSGT